MDRVQQLGVLTDSKPENFVPEPIRRGVTRLGGVLGGYMLFSNVAAPVLNKVVYSYQIVRGGLEHMPSGLVSLQGPEWLNIINHLAAPEWLNAMNHLAAPGQRLFMSLINVKPESIGGTLVIAMALGMVGGVRQMVIDFLSTNSDKK